MKIANLSNYENKKLYEPPKLVRQGHISQRTRGGSSTKTGGGTDGMDNKAGTKAFNDGAEGDRTGDTYSDTAKNIFDNYFDE